MELEQFKCEVCPHKQKWIPVSERLPKKEYETVLVCLANACFDIAIWNKEYGFRPWYAAFFEDCTPEWEQGVLAWMPLPEPYKKGGDAE